MRLYYMTNFETAMRFILPECRMRLSRFDKLNDPFELKSVKVAAKSGRSDLQEIIKEWHNKIGIICTGKHWKSPVMWAHYAQSHTGLCLGFDVPEDVAFEVQYVPERLPFVPNRKLPANGMSEELIVALLRTKYSQWQYEEEWRLLFKLTDPDPINGFHYVSFGDNLALREIIIGARCNATAVEIDKAIGAVDKSIEIIKARAAFESFTMVQQKKFRKVIIKARS